MRKKSSAISHQLSAKYFRRVLVPAFALLIPLAAIAFAADDCRHKVWKWNVDKKAALDLQQSVNDGHQPWRMDDMAAVATEAIADRKKDWADDNTLLDEPTVLSRTNDTAVMLARSADRGIRYHITLRKYSWLLPSASDNWRRVVWLPANVERIECPAQTH